jgi:hypothetical protein
MKKSILFFGAILFANVCFSQFLTTGTLTTDNKYRSGGIGLGYTAAPTFPTNTKFMVNGNSYFSGNIGLGTTAPSSMFHMPTGVLTIGNPGATPASYGLNSSRGIKVTAMNTTDIADVSVNYGGSFTQLSVANCLACFSNFAQVNDAVIRGNSSGSFILANEGNGDIKFETGNIYTTTKIQMRIDNIGNVGIGTGSTALPVGDKLSVNGVIHTKEVRVDLLGWPDFVFKKEYQLPSLQEVEKQINDKGHLANIPSAEEAEKNGILLGEMNKKLLQKVEELTLYIIQMNKEIELLKANAKN